MCVWTFCMFQILDLSSVLHIWLLCGYTAITAMSTWHYHLGPFNTLRPRQDGRHFADDIFTCIFFNENCCILIKFSLKYVRRGQIDNNPALVHVMAWRRPGDKPLSEPMMVSLPSHICVTRPQWVNSLAPERCCCGHELVIFKLISRTDISSISNATALRWMPHVLTDDYSALIQVMAWCHQK